MGSERGRKNAHFSRTAGRLSLTVRGPSASAVRVRPLAGPCTYDVASVAGTAEISKLPCDIRSSRDRFCLLFFSPAPAVDEEAVVRLPAQCWLLRSP